MLCCAGGITADNFGGFFIGPPFGAKIFGFACAEFGITNSLGMLFCVAN